MTGVDLLLYRPWSDAARKDGQDEPVDFSKKSKGEPQDLGYTDVEAVNREIFPPAKKRKYGEDVSGKTVSISKVFCRQEDSGSPDSGFNSPSESVFTSAYHQLFPGLYQQALANQAYQRDSFYRDAISRELSGRISYQCPEYVKKSEQVYQDSPLALVVKRSEQDPSSAVPESDDDVCSVYSSSDAEPSLGGVITKLTHHNSAPRDADISTAEKGHLIAKEGKREHKGTDGKGGGSGLVSLPQTSPFHLLPPSLYWPHGCSPLASHMPNPLVNPFRTIFDAAKPDSQNSFHKISFQNFSHLPSVATNFFPPNKSPIISAQRSPFSSPTKGTLISPLTSPVARVAFDYSVTNSNASEQTKQFALTTQTENGQKFGLPSKSPVKSPSSVKRKLPAFSPEKKSKSPKKNKATRRLNFDEDKSSPVSGTIIRELEEGEEPLVVRKGDIDPAYNIVEITEEAKAEIAKIDNKIGDYVCRLCKELYDDAFGLAQHRCSRIIHVEYRCPECDKVFNCPANLASHRRWHKPKGMGKGPPGCPTGKLQDTCVKSSDVTEPTPSTSKAENYEYETNFDEDHEEDKDSESHECSICFKSFKRQAYLRKHLFTHRRNANEASVPESIAHPVPHKADIHQPIASVHQTTTLLQPLPQLPQPSMMSPLSPPLLSPPFSPTEFIKCHLCNSNFFSHTALTIHFATVHRGRDPRHDPAFSASHGFVELALNNLASGPSPISPCLGSGIVAPKPQYFADTQATITNHFLHTQISATS